MNENLFFDRAQLRRCGSNVTIGKTVRIRYPELVEIADNVIIDDFSYISTALVIDGHVHISAGAKIIGGKTAIVRFESFSTLAPNVVLAAGSDDYIAGVATPMVPKEYKGNAVIGSIAIGRHCIVGAGTVVLPNVRMHEGAAVGALSLVKGDLEPWTLYAGIPAKPLRQRDRDRILSLEMQYLHGDGHN